MVMGVGMAVALGGCGGGAKRTTSTRLSAEAAGEKAKVVACMQRNGVRVFGNGKVQVSKTVTPVQLRAAEKRCVLEATKAARRKKNAVKKVQSFHRPQTFHSRGVANVVTCLHKAGVGIPSSDSALLSSTSGIKTRSPRVKAAIRRCRSESLSAASR
jgi:hypothetical protein